MGVSGLHSKQWKEQLQHGLSYYIFDRTILDTEEHMQSELS